MTSEHDKSRPPPYRRKEVIGNAMLYEGDCREVLRSLPADSVHCCVTSPPYFRLRNYNHENQIGMESTPAIFVATLVSVFREVRRVLRSDGTLWLNMGDSYSSGGRGGNPTEESSGLQGGKATQRASMIKREALCLPGFKPKELLGIPWRLAFALQEDGWYLRQEIIWSKPNPMPESVTDRCTKAHEHIFLLSKRERYYFDQEAILEPCSPIPMRGCLGTSKPR
jgi:DNA modification methylase